MKKILGYAVYLITVAVLCFTVSYTVTKHVSKVSNIEGTCQLTPFVTNKGKPIYLCPKQ